MPAISAIPASAALVSAVCRDEVEAQQRARPFDMVVVSDQCERLAIAQYELTEFDGSAHAEPHLFVVGLDLQYFRNGL